MKARELTITNNIKMVAVMVIVAVFSFDMILFVSTVMHS